MNRSAPWEMTPCSPLPYRLFLSQFSLFGHCISLVSGSETAENRKTDCSKVGFYVFTAVVKNCSAPWDITPCNPLNVNRLFGGTCRLHLHMFLWNVGWLLTDSTALYPRRYNSLDCNKTHAYKTERAVTDYDLWEISVLSDRRKFSVVSRG
jgi:hypothetical protein